MKALQIWITYHDDSQIEDYGLAGDDEIANDVQ